MSKLIPLTERELRIRFKAFSNIILQLIYPVVFMVILTRSLENLVKTINYYELEIPYLLFVFPGIIIITTLISAAMTGVSLFIDKREGMMMELIIAPKTSFLEYISSKIISSTTISFLQTVIISLLFIYLAISTGLLNAMFSLYTLVLFLKAIIIGLFSSILLNFLSISLAILIRSEEAFSALFSIMIFLLTYMSSVLYPLNALPSDIRGLAFFNPVTVITEISRRTILNLDLLNPETSFYILLYVCYLMFFMLIQTIVEKKWAWRLYVD